MIHKNEAFAPTGNSKHYKKKLPPFYDIMKQTSVGAASGRTKGTPTPLGRPQPYPGKLDGSDLYRDAVFPQTAC
eukprot:6572582-Pyramimonas_sp.AAC.1